MSTSMMFLAVAALFTLAMTSPTSKAPPATTQSPIVCAGNVTVPKEMTCGECEVCCAGWKCNLAVGTPAGKVPPDICSKDSKGCPTPACKEDYHCCLGYKCVRSIGSATGTEGKCL